MPQAQAIVMRGHQIEEEGKASYNQKIDDCKKERGWKNFDDSFGSQIDLKEIKNSNNS